MALSIARRSIFRSLNSCRGARVVSTVNRSAEVQVSSFSSSDSLSSSSILFTIPKSEKSTFQYATKIVGSSHPESNECRAMMLFKPSNTLAFFCSGISSTEWTTIKISNVDFVYCATQELLFTLDGYINNLELHAWDLRNPRLQVSSQSLVWLCEVDKLECFSDSGGESNPIEHDISYTHHQNYLVVSLRGKPFLVYYPFLLTDCECSKEDLEDDDNEGLFSMSRYHIFKIAREGAGGMKVFMNSHLDDQVMFVGWLSHGIVTPLAHLFTKTVNYEVVQVGDGGKMVVMNDHLDDQLMFVGWLSYGMAMPPSNCSTSYESYFEKNRLFTIPRSEKTRYGTKIVGSSHGWLACFNYRSNELYLSNPLSGRRVNLPPIDNLSISKLNLRRGIGIIKIIISCSDPESKECRAVMIFNSSNELAFCCPGISRCTEWTKIKPLYDDIVYCATHKLFFAILDNLNSELVADWMLREWDLRRKPLSPSQVWSCDEHLFSRCPAKTVNYNKCRSSSSLPLFNNLKTRCLQPFGSRSVATVITFDDDEIECPCCHKYYKIGEPMKTHIQDEHSDLFVIASAGNMSPPAPSAVNLFVPASAGNMSPPAPSAVNLFVPASAGNMPPASSGQTSLHATSGKSWICRCGLCFENSKKFANHILFCKYVNWKLPAPGFVKLNTDGSCNVINPTVKHKTGYSGGGGVIRDCLGLYFGFYDYLGMCNPSLAELSALHRGLSLIIQGGYTKVEIELDCLIIVKAIDNLLKGGIPFNQLDYVFQKSTGAVYRHLLLRVVSMLQHKDFEFRIYHIFRDGNTIADTLSKMGVRFQRFGLYSFHSMPQRLKNEIEDQYKRGQHLK